MSRRMIDILVAIALFSILFYGMVTFGPWIVRKKETPVEPRFLVYSVENGFSFADLNSTITYTGPVVFKERVIFLAGVTFEKGWEEK